VLDGGDELVVPMTRWMESGKEGRSGGDRKGGG